MEAEMKKLEQSIINSKVENLVAAREIKLFHSFIEFRMSMLELEMKFLKDSKKILSENILLMKDVDGHKQ